MVLVHQHLLARGNWDADLLSHSADRYRLQGFLPNTATVPAATADGRNPPLAAGKTSLPCRRCGQTSIAVSRESGTCHPKTGRSVPWRCPHVSRSALPSPRVRTKGATDRELPAQYHEHSVVWLYSEHRPHTALGGRTRNEVYFHRFPAHRRPRCEPRPRWPRGSPCARPWALVKGKPGVDLELEVTYYAGRQHLPIVQLRAAA